ncbi:hypothetical protein C0J52_14920 [Blattella germanica]|nr:hypothetical protein C0J52_14920 [Blattella germanica]
MFLIFILITLKHWMFNIRKFYWLIVLQSYFWQCLRGSPVISTRAQTCFTTRTLVLLQAVGCACSRKV